MAFSRFPRIRGDRPPMNEEIKAEPIVIDDFAVEVPSGN